MSLIFNIRNRYLDFSSFEAHDFGRTFFSSYFMLDCILFNTPHLQFTLLLVLYTFCFICQQFVVVSYPPFHTSGRIHRVINNSQDFPLKYHKRDATIRYVSTGIKRNLWILITFFFT